MLIFAEDRWIGNQWASVDIEPVEEAYFLPLLTYLMTTYAILPPKIIDGIDGYLAEFELLGTQAILSIDTWTFSIAFEQDAVRDRVLEALCQLPDDYFDP